MRMDEIDIIRRMNIKWDGMEVAIRYLRSNG